MRRALAAAAAIAAVGGGVFYYAVDVAPRLSGIVRAPLKIQGCLPTAGATGNTAVTVTRTGNVTTGGPWGGPAATNLILYSEQADVSGTWPRSNIATVTADAAVAPDGTTTADLVVPNTTNTTHYISQTITLGGAAVMSAFFKSAGFTQVSLYANTDAGDQYAIFNLTGNGSVATNTTPSAGIVSMGNGWYRAWATFTRTAAGAILITPASGGGLSLSGDGTSGFYVWGVQAEKGTAVGTYVKTTSASASTVFASPFTFFPADANTVSHVAWNGTALVERVSTSWSANGTVPQNAASGVLPPSAGAPFTNSNYYSASGFDIGSDFNTVCAVVNITSTATNQIIASKGMSNTDGWYFHIIGGSAIFGVSGLSTAGAGTSWAPGSATPVVGWNVICGGKTSTSVWLKVNGNAAVSTAINGTPVPAANPAYIGRYGPATIPFLGSIYEVWFSREVASADLFGRVTASAIAKLASLQTCTDNQLPVGPAGAEVYAAGTNLVLQSDALDNVSWASAGTPTITANQGLAPDGTQAMDSMTSSAVTDRRQQAALTSTSLTGTASVWARAVTGTAIASVLTKGNAASPTACTCSVSAGTCTTDTSTGYCLAYATVGTSPVRLAAQATFTATPTSWDFAVHDGQYNTTFGAGVMFWGAQWEAGLYPTPYVPTTTIAVTRNGTTATVPLPNLHTTNTWCIAATATPGGWLWPSAPANGTILRNYQGVATNSISLYVNGGGVVLEVWDGAGAARLISTTHGLTGSAPARFVACNNAGALALYVNGRPIGSASGAGTGLPSATLTPLGIGAAPGGTFLGFDGSIRDVLICPNDANPLHCQ